jgi:hypothetical protein
MPTSEDIFYYIDFRTLKRKKGEVRDGVCYPKIGRRPRGCEYLTKSNPDLHNKGYPAPNAISKSCFYD